MQPVILDISVIGSFAFGIAGASSSDRFEYCIAKGRIRDLWIGFLVDATYLHI
jgi:hypothetical protein